MAEESAVPTAANRPYRIEYRRSYTHQHLNADGVWVGLNGYDRIILNFFNDSPPLPTVIMTETTPDGKKFVPPQGGPKMTMEAQEGAIRIFGTSIGLSLPTVRELVVTLQNFIRLAEEAERSRTK
jgi:hypothetical protein